MVQDLKTLFVANIENLSGHTKNFLKDHKIFSVQELIDFFNKYGYSTIQHFGNAGQKTAQEIYDVFVKYSNLTPIYSIENFSGTTKNGLELAGITTVQALIDYCNKYGVNELKKLKGLGQKAVNETKALLSSELAEQLSSDIKIKQLESSISEYKLAIVHMENELTELKAKRNTTIKQTKESQR